MMTTRKYNHLWSKQYNLPGNGKNKLYCDLKDNESKITFRVVVEKDRYDQNGNQQRESHDKSPVICQKTFILDNALQAFYADLLFCGGDGKGIFRFKQFKDKLELSISKDFDKQKKDEQRDFCNAFKIDFYPNNTKESIDEEFLKFKPSQELIKLRNEEKKLDEENSQIQSIEQRNIIIFQRKKESVDQLKDKIANIIYEIRMGKKGRIQNG